MNTYKISSQGTSIAIVKAADEIKALYALLYYGTPRSVQHGIINAEGFNDDGFDKCILPLRVKKDNVFETLSVEKIG